MTKKTLLTRISLPLKSNVLSAPRRGNASNARTLSSSAALGPWPCGVGDVNGGGTGCRAVTPPCADDVISGICCPLGDSGFAVPGFAPAAAAAAARRARGMYGVYVVCGAAEGCRGGGRMGPGRGGGMGSSGEEGLRGVEGGERKDCGEDGLVTVEAGPFPTGKRSG